MSRQHQDQQQQANQEERGRQQLCAAIGKQVLHALGQPGDLHLVQVRHLWEVHFRVNVLVGVDAASAKVAHSYFLEADLEGNIMESSPKITRRY
jgi:hypothetical protein